MPVNNLVWNSYELSGAYNEYLSIHAHEYSVIYFWLQASGFRLQRKARSPMNVENEYFPEARSPKPEAQSSLPILLGV